MTAEATDLPLLLKSQTDEAESDIPGVTFKRKKVTSSAKGVDITEKFVRTASGLASWGLIYATILLTVVAALPTGELVKDDFFTLYEAVGALEVCFLAQ